MSQTEAMAREDDEGTVVVMYKTMKSPEHLKIKSLFIGEVTGISYLGIRLIPTI